MVVRPGQIARSRENGYWNPVQHFAFLIKSAQSLQVFPALQGRLQWVPVEDVAATAVDLALHEGIIHPVYHIDNPVGQPWEAMVQTLASELEISELIPFEDWIRKVRRSPLSMETDNPALRVIDFLASNFEHVVRWIDSRHGSCERAFDDASDNQARARRSSEELHKGVEAR